MSKKVLIICITSLLLLAGPLIQTVLAQTPPASPPPDAMKTLTEAVANASTAANTAFMLLCAALVLLMTPGLAFFYGGFVRARNVLNTMMMSFLLMGLIGVTWVLWGYSFAFDPATPFFGGLDFLFLNNVGTETSSYITQTNIGGIGVGGLAVDQTTKGGTYAVDVPHQAFMIYQAMFAIITPALISGAIVERMSFKAYFWFVLIWSTIIYSSIAHMVWAAGGFLGLYGGIGALDFAGGTVVHISSGVSALVAAWMIGPRKTYPDQPAPPHNVPYILLGAGLLWFGWFGFNAGSALGAGSLATVAFVATNTAAAAAALMWIILEWVLRGKPTAVGIATGAVAGLVGITPAAGFVTPIAAILIGAITATGCFFAISLKVRFQFDDSLDTFGVHGVGGTIGALLTGVFATKLVNSAGGDGLLYGNPAQLVSQLIGVIVTYILAAVGTFIILKVIDATIGLRPKPDQEIQGMDINEHGEEGYGEEFAS